jgi:hypothetical protein
MLTVGVLGEVNQRPGRPADLYLNIDYGLVAGWSSPV